MAEPYIFQGGHLIPQALDGIAQEIKDRYPNLKLVWVPTEDRVKNSAGQQEDPYAIFDMQTQSLVKTFDENTIHMALGWLYDNDGSRVDLYQKFIDDNIKAEKAHKAVEAERTAEAADFVATVAGSKKHDFKHNGKLIGDGYRAGLAQN